MVTARLGNNRDSSRCKNQAIKAHKFITTQHHCSFHNNKRGKKKSQESGDVLWLLRIYCKAKRNYVFFSILYVPQCLFKVYLKFFQSFVYLTISVLDTNMILYLERSLFWKYFLVNWRIDQDFLDNSNLGKTLWLSSLMFPEPYKSSPWRRVLLYSSSTLTITLISHTQLYRSSYEFPIYIFSAF